MHPVRPLATPMAQLLTKLYHIQCRSKYLDFFELGVAVFSTVKCIVVSTSEICNILITNENKPYTILLTIKLLKQQQCFCVNNY